MIFSLPLQSLSSEELNTWTVAAEEFVFTKGQTDNSVTKGIGETVPKSILENLNRYFVRNIRPGEELERKRYDLRKKRQDLYLQLSSQYQKRDSLFLSYSGKKLEKQKAEQNKKIAEIEKKINDNLEELKSAEAEEKSRIENELKKIEDKKSPEERRLKDGRESKDGESLKGESLKKSGSASMSSFFKNIISNETAVVKSEEIKLYMDKSESLFQPSDEAKKQGYESPIFNEEMCENGINSYLTGSISIYGNYISVTVTVYLYPGAKKIGTVTEVGNVNDIEFLASSIVTQLIPMLTNSMPVTLNFKINQGIGFDSVNLYIDDILQKTDGKNLIIDSGVHSFQIVADGYKSLSTSYYFEGDTKYNIEINLEEKNEGSVFVNLKKPVIGSLYTNGVLSEKINDSQSKIIINGSKVLGEFISEDGRTDFFYIPEKLYYDENYVEINPKPIDRGAYIEKRRKWMYGSYSAFMISLIPVFITQGTFLNQKKLYYDGIIDYETAVGWQTAANVCAGISIGLGVFWGIELVRYLVSANSVLPEKAKQGEEIEFGNIDYGGGINNNTKNEKY